MESMTSYTFPVQNDGIFRHPDYEIEGTDGFKVSPSKDTGKAR